MTKLSVSQREAIRHFHQSGDDTGVAARTRNSLVGHGLLVCHDGSYSLTRRGITEHERIMASGDGPEALKQLLRF